MYRIYDEEDLDALPAGKWGIREPAPERNGTRRASGMSFFGDSLKIFGRDW